MKKHILMMIALFLSGYILGNGSIPKGMELQIFMIAALFSGFIAGSWVNKKWTMLKTRKRKEGFHVFGYKISKTKPRTTADPQFTNNVVSMEKDKTKQQSKPCDSVCDICNGEPVTPCPKCKKKATGG